MRPGRLLKGTDRECEDDARARTWRQGVVALALPATRAPPTVAEDGKLKSGTKAGCGSKTVRAAPQMESQRWLVGHCAASSCTGNRFPVGNLSPPAYQWSSAVSRQWRYGLLVVATLSILYASKLQILRKPIVS